jgi:hypothetical protein
MRRWDIEVFELKFDLLRFESSEIREMWCFEEFADLMMIERVEIEHLEIELLVSESMRWLSI